MRQPEVLVFTPPFDGHANVLEAFRRQFADQYKIVTAFTGWTNIPPNRRNIHENSTILARSELHETDPALWTFQRVLELYPECLRLAESIKPKLIIYDPFSPEGKFVADGLSVPSWCSVPAFLGPYDNQQYIREKLALDTNVSAIAELKNRYGIVLNPHHVEGLSDGLFLPSQHNLVWSYHPVVPPDYMNGRALNNYYLVGNPRAEQHIDRVRLPRKDGKKTIFISFGTVVMNNVWNNQPEMQNQMRSFIGELADIWGKDKNVRVVFVTQGKEVLANYPDNWEIYDYVDQIAQLAEADVFVTHGGNNSFHESLKQRVPMAVIPFFGDQLRVAQRAQEMGIGYDFGRQNSIDTRASKEFLTKAYAHEIADGVQALLTEQRFRDSYNALQLLAVSLHALLKSEIFLGQPMEVWVDERKTSPVQMSTKRGEAWYGNQGSRFALEGRTGLHGVLHMLEIVPFSTVADAPTDLPGLVDTYNDSIRNKDFWDVDMQSHMVEYKRVLQAYQTFLNGETDVCRMCVKALDFFGELFGVRFLVDRFDPKNNYITAREMQYVLKNRDRFAGKTNFYYESENGWNKISYEDVELLLQGTLETRLRIEDESIDWSHLSDGVFVTSAEPLKLAAVEEALKEQFPNMQLTVNGIKPPIKANEQLTGVEETVFETVHRLLSLKKSLDEKNTKFGIIISTCSGIEVVDGKTQDVAVVVVMDSFGRTSITKSEGVVYPEKYVEIAKAIGFDITTIGRVIAEAYGKPEMHTNAIALLSGGLISRQRLIRRAVKSGFVQMDRYYSN